MMHEIQTLMLEYYELWGRMDAVYDRWAKAHGMTYTELMVLYALWETKQPITQRDLCQEQHLPKQTVNSVLHALAKRQLVVFRESALGSPAQGNPSDTSGKSAGRRRDPRTSCS